MPPVSPSLKPTIPFNPYVNILVALVGYPLIPETAIAQTLQPQDTKLSSLTTLTFEFVHPFSPQKVTLSPEHKTDQTLSDRPDPLPLPDASKPKQPHSIPPLDFTLPAFPTSTHSSEPKRPTALPSAHLASSAPPTPLPLDTLFSGNSDSLVARAIGCAEGTRSPDGGKTWAYNGHTDPGNGVWNMGTFSWQHGASSPEEADRKQLTRLRKQALVLTRKAEAAGIPWGLEEQLNAFDLANQSPSAALNPGGYIDRLKEAQEEGLTGPDAILWARTWSYRHSSGTRWNAPGLGNTHYGIRTDQKRRQDAIKEAIAHFPF